MESFCTVVLVTISESFSGFGGSNSTNIRNRSIPSPSVPCGFSIRLNALTVPKQSRTPRIFLDAAHCLFELPCFAIRRKNVGVKESNNAALCSNCQKNMLAKDKKKCEGQRTVMTTPNATIKKLNDCCVALATFSLPLSSPHRYLPSSDMTDICFRVGFEPEEGPLPPRVL